MTNGLTSQDGEERHHKQETATHTFSNELGTRIVVAPAGLDTQNSLHALES